MEETFWTVVVFAFVVSTLGLVAFAVARIFGLGGREHRPQH